jgi:HK97 family phage prohead protease
MELITQRLKLFDINPEAAREFVRLSGLSDEDDWAAKQVEFVRKGLVPSDVQFEDGERAAVSYITTKDVDRDGEIVEPFGVDLEAYRKNPVVLFGHNYSELPIGKNLWIKSDGRGLIAKTQYASHEFAQKVYEYRKEGMPLAQSIGFIPIKWEDNTDKANKPWSRRYTKWHLLEYSDVPVPANPEAVAIAVSKGLIQPVYEPTTEKAGRVLSSKNRTLIMAAVQQMDEAAEALRALLTATDQSEPADVPAGDTVEMSANAETPAEEKVVDPVVEKKAITKTDLIEALQGAIKQNRVSVAGIVDETIARRLGRVTLD